VEQEASFRERFARRARTSAHHLYPDGGEYWHFYACLLAQCAGDCSALGGIYAPDIVDANQYYRLISAMFIHGGLAHLFFNMLSLYFIGRNVEQLYGGSSFLVIYLVGGLIGSAVSFAFGNFERISVGSSGAVFAIFAARLAFFYRYRKRLSNYGREQVQSDIFLLLINLFVGFSSSNIDNWGHLGGLMGGATLSWVLSAHHHDYPCAGDAHPPFHGGISTTHSKSPPATVGGLLLMMLIVLYRLA
jgi:membrane associated rhomboid family serine protease